MAAAALEDGQPYASMAGKLDAQLLKGLDTMGFTYMTPVQHRVLTELPSLRSDCLVQAKTGTGKTLAFLLPALHTLLQDPSPPPKGQVAILIITPTRELAQQIAKECDQVTSQLSRPLECHIAVGGTARASTLNRFMKGAPSILVATPGRLKDYLSEDATARRLSSIRTLVLDEADTMLETGFLADVKRILELIPPKTAGWQGMCFSATVPPKVKDVVNVVLKPGYSNISTIEKNEVPTHERVPQSYILIPSVIDSFNVLAALLDIETQSAAKTIVFGITANLVALYAKLFGQGLTAFKVYEIHSRLSQNIRTRTTAEFKEAKTGIMFASDVIGRGMDFPNVDLVIQVGIPSSGEQYVHRVGRTARAGNDGRAITLLPQAESFFLSRNKHLPIKQADNAAEVLAHASACTPAVTAAMNAIDESTKQRAYSSFIGFFAGSGLLKPLQLDKTGLVRLANDFAEQGMKCPEPPPMEKKTVGKMGLKGVPGFRYATGDEIRSAHPPRQNNQTQNHQLQARSQSNGRGGQRDVLSPDRNGAVSKTNDQANGRGRGHRPRRGGGNQRGRGGGAGRGRGSTNGTS